MEIDLETNVNVDVAEDNDNSEPRRSRRARRIPGWVVDFYPDVIPQNTYLASLIPNTIARSIVTTTRDIAHELQRPKALEDSR